MVMGPHPKKRYPHYARVTNRKLVKMSLLRHSTKSLPRKETNNLGSLRHSIIIIKRIVRVFDECQFVIVEGRQGGLID